MYKIAVLDLETGGLKENENPITEIAFNIYDAKTMKLLDSYNSFVKPYNDLKIVQKALDASQVTMKDVNNGKDIDIVLKDFVELMTKHTKSKKDKPVLIGHNIVFDKKFLKYIFDYKKKNLYDYIDDSEFDTLRLMKFRERNDKDQDKYKYNLTACCDRCGIKLKSAHGAQADITATFELFKYLMSKDDTTNVKQESNKQRNFFQM